MREKRIFLETPRKLMRDIPWEPIRKVSLMVFLIVFIGSMASTVATGDPTFEWIWWWFWFGFFLTILPMIMGRVTCGWFCPYAALHDIFFTKLKYRRIKWPEKLRRIRFPLLFILLGVTAVLEIFWEWDFFIWYPRMFLVLAIIWGLVFEPRDWCKYVCILGAYAQLFSRIRILGVRVDPDLCMKCPRCICAEKCLIGVDWKRVVEKTHITPDYCVVCMRCANACPYGAVYAWRVH